MLDPMPMPVYMPMLLPIEIPMEMPMYVLMLIPTWEDDETEEGGSKFEDDSLLATRTTDGGVEVGA
ncbi:hypothetical protein FKW77_006975 [Venturia effusa]|uniref:Uncharacterized protein n=1 Tax=Venturia effusa TaxID=50376 RepID=A0A517LJ37_9PEZI|nr:hypothetical protein FKW77_006975 [Venturia effusa]